MTRSNGRPVTMQDVARRVGVSRTTVSFVLSDRPSAKIPESTRKSIWDAVEELGYRPNAAAQGLASQKTRLIGLITDIATSAFAGDIIQGAQEAAWANNKLLLIASSPGDPDRDAAIVRTMLERRVEGILYATSWHHEVSLPKEADEVPVVLVNCFDRAGAFTSILPDEEGGGYLATRARSMPVTAESPSSTWTPTFPPQSADVPAMLAPSQSST